MYTWACPVAQEVSPHAAPHPRVEQATCPAVLPSPWDTEEGHKPLPWGRRGTPCPREVQSPGLTPKRAPILVGTLELWNQSWDTCVRGSPERVPWSLGHEAGVRRAW